MRINKETMAMCQLVAFAENEIKNALANRINVEEYAQEVLKRFQALYPDAALILDDFKVGSDAWRKSIKENHVHCWINGTWEFYSATDSMAVSVTTDGAIHLDEGTSETLLGCINE